MNKSIIYIYNRGKWFGGETTRVGGETTRGVKKGAKRPEGERPGGNVFGAKCLVTGMKATVAKAIYFGNFMNKWRFFKI